MTNMQAAIGLAQVEKLDEILALRNKQMDIYYNELSGLQGISLRQYAEWCEPVHWMMTITLDHEYDQVEFLDYMKEKDIDCRQMINPVHKAEHFVEQFNDEFPVATRISSQSVHLPSGSGLGSNQIKSVALAIRNFLV